MEDHRLKAFCLLAEMKSFSRAAEAKFITQSAMSHLIKNLEDELGTKLINRHPKTISLTPAGKVFYEHAKSILALYRSMEDDVYTTVRKVKGTLHIGASPTVATYLLSQVFYGFLKKYPEVGIEVSVSNTEKIIDILNEGAIDIGMVEGNIKDTIVFSEVIAEDEIVLIASDDNPLSGEKSIRPGRLITQPFIMPEKGSGLREFIDTFLQTNSIDPKDIKVSMTIGNPELIIQMVQAGIGISLVSKWAVFRAVKEGSVKILSIKDKKLRRKFYTVSLEKEPSTLTVKTFKDFIREYRFFVPF
ncbi:MAG TPA: LysR family transcriptional regulator [Nitrospirae bacterium]|nr:LysR family transcriptional regulator [Nitrospirota bacterium]